MMIGVDPEDSKRFARHIWIGDAARLYNCSNVLALILQLALQSARRTMFGYFAQAFASHLTILPEAIVDRVGGADDVAESCAPAVGRKVLGMCVARPFALES